MKVYYTSDSIASGIGVQGHADLQRHGQAARRPGLGQEHALRGERGSQCSRGGGEDRPEGIALGLENMAALALDGLR
jgi:hypothetical protein